MRGPERTTVRPRDTRGGILSSGGISSALLAPGKMHEWVLCLRGPSRGHYGPPERHMRRYSFLRRDPERTTVPQATHEAIFRPREDSLGHDSSPGRHTRGYSFLGRSQEGTTVRPSDSQVGISSSGGLPSALLSTWMTRERVFGPRQCSRGHYVPPERHMRRYSILGRDLGRATVPREDARVGIMYSRGPPRAL
jgi:hypothetical protein